MLEVLSPVETKKKLDTRVPAVVRIINGALDDDADFPGSIVLHGRIDQNTLRFLKVDSSYQRPLGDRKDIYDALKSGTLVPNIDIGVRGQQFHSEGEDYIITDPAYIIDGWQRVGTALQILEVDPGFPIRIYATVHFKTDDVSERHRFAELNKNIMKVSPNLHLRNMRDESEAILTLYGLSFNDRSFPLFGKVSWSQSMARGDLTTAMALSRVTIKLHSHRTPGRGNRSTDKRVDSSVASQLAFILKSVPLNTFRKNVHTFFDVVEECWGLSDIEYAKKAPQVKSGFLTTLARMFSDHLDFWDTSERGFFVAADLRRKLAGFKLSDPAVQNLAGGGGAALSILYELIVSHINSGKRTGRLRQRYAKPTPPPQVAEIESA